MELSQSQQDETQQDSESSINEDIINELLDQNSQLRMEIATLKTTIKNEIKELELLQQMNQSRNIPPDVWERLSKLDIR